MIICNKCLTNIQDTNLSYVSVSMEPEWFPCAHCDEIVNELAVEVEEVHATNVVSLDSYKRSRKHPSRGNL